MVSVDVSWFGTGIAAPTDSASPRCFVGPFQLCSKVFIVLSKCSQDARQRIIHRTLLAVGGADLGRPYCKNVC